MQTCPAWGTHPIPPLTSRRPAPLRNSQHRPPPRTSRSPAPSARAPSPRATRPLSQTPVPCAHPFWEAQGRRAKTAAAAAAAAAGLAPSPGRGSGNSFQPAGGAASGATRSGARQRAPGMELGGAGLEGEVPEPRGREREGREWRHLAGRSGQGGAERGTSFPGALAKGAGPPGWRTQHPALPRKAERDAPGGMSVKEKHRAGVQRGSS